VDQGVQAASHQRQLSLKYSEIQQRLIDNQSLLNTLEKAGGPGSLENLLAELKRRVEQDKEALRQWTALRKSTFGSSNTKNPALAARLLQFSRGCALALQFMSEDNPQVRLKRFHRDAPEILKRRGARESSFLPSFLRKRSSKIALDFRKEFERLNDICKRNSTSER